MLLEKCRDVFLKSPQEPINSKKRIVPKTIDHPNDILKAANEQRCQTKSLFKKLQIMAKNDRIKAASKC